MWNALNCLDWILCFKEYRPVYCEADASAGFFGMNCNRNHSTDGIAEPCGKRLTIWLRRSATDIATARWLTSPCRRSSTAFNSSFQPHWKSHQTWFHPLHEQDFLYKTPHLCPDYLLLQVDDCALFLTHWIEELYWISEYFSNKFWLLIERGDVDIPSPGVLTGWGKLWISIILLFWVSKYSEYFVIEFAKCRTHSFNFAILFVVMHGNVKTLNNFWPWSINGFFSNWTILFFLLCSIIVILV